MIFDSSHKSVLIMKSFIWYIILNYYYSSMFITNTCMLLTCEHRRSWKIVILTCSIITRYNAYQVGVRRTGPISLGGPGPGVLARPCAFSIKRKLIPLRMRKTGKIPKVHQVVNKINIVITKLSKIFLLKTEREKCCNFKWSL